MGIMNIVASIYDINQIEKLNNLATHVLIPVEDFQSSKGLNLLDSINICKNYGLKPILKMDGMIHEYMLENFKNLVIEYKEYDVLFYITDLGGAKILIDLGLVNKTIFNPNTLITNYLDAKLYSDYGFNAVSMSLEITINDVIKTIEKTKVNLFYQVFGHQLMFHSKRTLVSLYEKKENLDIKRDNMYLIEEKRKDKYPLLETNLGTYIYRSYQISLIKHIKDLDLKYAYFESRFINFDVYLEVLNVYKKYLNGILTLDEALNALSLLPLNIEDGFTYKDSVYQKEEF
jgi:putative protease